MGEERRVFQIGGIAGLAAGVLFTLIVPIFVLLLPSMPGDDPDRFLGTVFPQYQSVFTLMGILALLASLLSVALFLALHRSLRDTSPTYALGGLLFYILYVGVFVFAPSELVGHLFITPQLAELHAAAGTDAERAAVVQIFQALDLASDQLFFAGSLFFGVSALVYGLLMLGTRSYSRAYGVIAVLVALFGIGTLAFLVATPGIRVPYLPVVLWFLLGWKIFMLSRGG